MNPESVTVMIERLGFPVFVAVCAIGFFWLVFRYFTKATEKKDAQFCEFVSASNVRVDEITRQHNETITGIAEGFKETIRETHCELKQSIDKLRESVEVRTRYVDEQTNVLKNIADKQNGG